MLHGTYLSNGSHTDYGQSRFNSDALIRLPYPQSAQNAREITVICLPSASIRNLLPHHHLLYLARFALIASSPSSCSTKQRKETQRNDVVQPNSGLVPATARVQLCCDAQRAWNACALYSDYAPKGGRSWWTAHQDPCRESRSE